MNYNYYKAMKAYNYYFNVKAENNLRNVLLLIGSKNKGEMLG